MPDLFISYAREDRDTALALANALQARGVDVWWDRALTGGGDFAAEIEHNLRAAPLALVLWSPASVLSDFVRDESSRARDMQKLLPVRIAEVELPLGFGTLHTLDMLGWNGDPEADACEAVIGQVLKRLASASPTGSEQAARIAGLVQRSAEDSLTARRGRRSLLWALGGAATAGIGGLGWVGWQRLNQHEALAHLGQALEDHFANPPRLESAQSEYAAALDLDGSLSPAHYFLGHLYAQLMLRGDPPPSGDVLAALRDDARRHFQDALGNADRLDGSQRVIARAQLALLGQGDMAAPVARSVEPATGEVARPSQPIPGTGTGGGIGSAPPPRPPEVVPPAPTGSPTRPPPGEVASLMRVPAASAVTATANQRSRALFSDDRDSRLSATTSLTLDPAGAAEALPVAITQARRAVRTAPQADGTRVGVASTLALLERASPSTLRENSSPVRALLSELAALPDASSLSGAAGRVAAALDRANARRPVAYIQFASERQRPVALRLAARLAEAGYVTPPVELTGEARAPAKPSLRSQGASDPDLARWCQRLLEDTVGAPAEWAVLRTARPSTDTYEIWFDKSLCADGGRSVPACGR